MVYRWRQHSGSRMCPESSRIQAGREDDLRQQEAVRTVCESEVGSVAKYLYGRGVVGSGILCASVCALQVSRQEPEPKFRLWLPFTRIALGILLSSIGFQA